MNNAFRAFEANLTMRFGARQWCCRCYAGVTQLVECDANRCRRFQAVHPLKIFENHCIRPKFFGTNQTKSV
jgi:hypothetical protein